MYKIQECNVLGYIVECPFCDIDITATTKQRIEYLLTGHIASKEHQRRRRAHNRGLRT